MAIRRPTLRILRQLMVSVGLQTDHVTRDLTQAWVRAWDELAQQWRHALDDAIAYAADHGGQWPSPGELARIERLYRAVQASEEALTQLGQRAGVTIADAAGNIVTTDADFEPRLIASQLPAAEQAQAAARFAANILPSALDAITARAQSQIHALTRPLDRAAVEAMKRELVTGIAVGSNPRDVVARRMVDRVQGAFEGGLSRAANIARTEMLDAYRTTSRYAHAANADVVASWQWSAVFDKRTCPSCWAMHGRVFPLEQPGPLDHQQGRCARLPKTKTWRELGYDIDEPADEIPDAQAKFWSLPHDDRTAIMGPRRLELLRSGRIGWDDLPMRRPSPGWRVSYGPRPVRDLERIADTRRAAGVAAAPHPAAPKQPPTVTPKPGAKAKAAEPYLPSKAAPKIEDLIADLRGRLRPGDSTLPPSVVRPFVDGTYGALRVVTTGAGLYGPGQTSLLFTGTILTRGGDVVGRFSRTIGRDKSGRLVAYHGHLELEAKYQGQGFGDAFNGNLIHWYRRSGVEAIELYANIDVGGYAWAARGFDFAHAYDADRILTRLAERVQRIQGGRVGGAAVPALDMDLLRRTFLGATDAQIREQVRLARDLLARAGALKFGAPGYPTAYEISQLGRWTGAGKGDTWIGKLIMLGSDWDGVLRL